MTYRYSIDKNAIKANSRHQVINHVPQDGGAIIGIRGYLAGAIIAVNYGNIISIGRDPSKCNLIIEGDFISRIHCRLSYNNRTGMYMLEDRSINGVILPDGLRTHKGQIISVAGGTHICVGTYSEELLLR